MLRHMNVYRLDHHTRSGEVRPVCDLFGPVLIRSRRHAEDVARQTVEARGGRVYVTRIRGAGELRRMGYVDRTGFHREAQA